MNFYKICIFPLVLWQFLLARFLDKICIFFLLSLDEIWNLLLNFWWNLYFLSTIFWRNSHSLSEILWWNWSFYCNLLTKFILFWNQLMELIFYCINLPKLAIVSWDRLYKLASFTGPISKFHDSFMQPIGKISNIFSQSIDKIHYSFFATFWRNLQFFSINSLSKFVNFFLSNLLTKFTIFFLNS